jgi:arsenate reductase
MSDRNFNVLFLCTGNTARSILAESILRKDGAGRFTAFSAGSQPKGQVNPLALETLQKLGYPLDGLRSKSWDEFERPGAPQMDFIITVCDNAAGEVCPIWPGHPLQAHWGIEDPAAVEGTTMQKLAAFATAFRYLKNRISLFAALPIAKLEASLLRDKVHEIGRSEGATPGKR